MNQKNSQIYNMLPLYYEGKLNEDQVLEVQQWIALSDENRHIALQMEEIYQATDTLYVLNHADTENALKVVHGKMNIRKDYRIWIWAQRVAAILFIPLLIVTFLKYFSKEDNTVGYIRLATNPGMIASATLPDGTVVTLNSNSSLVYPSRFEGESREVQLNGEAYFKVTKDKKHSFIVKTPQKAAIRVYGTQFDVEAYTKDGKVTATLVTGSIAMAYAKEGNKWCECKIKPGEEIVYSAKEQNVQVAKVTVDVAISWKDSKLIFNNTPLNEVLNSLSKRFDVDFIVKNPKCNEGSFTGVLEKQRLDRILEYFRISSNMHFRYVDGNNIRQEKQIIEVY
ncbi:FecR family protein [uncultured Bacteroides sp.]|uniref:FecR family protein n=1 Tax=uncultured Bacteroides sp. TaxID=162156 RepID=UPI002AAAB8A2|nr:FecR family protein [uncultured Bacteroides sp.]